MSMTAQFLLFKLTYLLNPLKNTMALPYHSLPSCSVIVQYNKTRAN